MLLTLKGGFTDDGYIHIQYSKNMIERGEYSFNAGEVSFGTTSPLWVMMQASLGHIFGSGEALMITSRCLSWICGFLTLILMYVLARTLGLGPYLAALCSLLFATHAWFVRWTAMSMETSAAVAAVAAVGIAGVHAFDSRRSALLLGFFMALSALLRPEAYLLLPVYIVAIFLQGRRVDLACVVRTLSVYAVLLSPWLLFAKLHIGSFLPNTAAAKSGGIVADPWNLLRKFDPIIRILGSAEGVEVLCIVAALFIFGRKCPLLAKERRFLLLWVVALPVAYVILDVQVLSRYMLLISPFVVVFGVLALRDITERFGADARVRRWVVTACAGVMIITNVGFYYVVVLPPSRAFAHDLTHNLKRLALYLRANSDGDAVVAAADIGYLAFYSGRRVLDLGGLVDTDTGRLRERFPYEEVIHKGMYLRLARYPRVDFFIDRALAPDRFEGRRLEGYRFERVHLEQVASLGVRKPGPYYYTLYRLHREASR
jgi:hypothetical protein